MAAIYFEFSSLDLWHVALDFPQYFEILVAKMLPAVRAVHSPPRVSLVTTTPRYVPSFDSKMTQWHTITAYLYEPAAARAVRHEHTARSTVSHDSNVSGARGSFSVEDTVEDTDRAIPPGTEVVIRPRFPRVR